MQPEDVEYYERRALQEREKAKTCADAGVARTHIDMAEEYERRAKGNKPLTIALPG